MKGQDEQIKQVRMGLSGCCVEVTILYEMVKPRMQRTETKTYGTWNYAIDAVKKEIA